MVGPGKPIDTNKYYIICANTLGSHYGSTNPLSIDPSTKVPYYYKFPFITNRDITRAFIELTDYLGISKIKYLIGASLGGQQALEWGYLRPNQIEQLILIATNAKHSPWGIAFNESQRMAIATDSTWGENLHDAGKEGLKVARSIAMLSYRTAEGYNFKQLESSHCFDQFKAASYQQYQGQKLAQRFNAFSYWYLSKAMDSHDISRGRKNATAVLNQIQPHTHVVGIDSDLLFPIEEQQLLYKHIPSSTFYEISSIYGHDGFLTEHHQMKEILFSILDKKKQRYILNKKAIPNFN
jgi:homoserine O-acetyltransferase